ncbi:Ankyrin repeat-containing domain protein [Russula decolorans]
MQLLLSHGADVNVVDHRGDSPLYKASRSQRLDAVKFLVKGGAEVNVRDKSNSTPLHEASGSGSLLVVQLLLSLGADIHALDHQGGSALHKASRYQKLDAVNLLVNGGADVNVRDKCNSTPLHGASGNRNLNIAHLLLTHGADVHVFDHWGDTPLHKSFRSLTFDIMGFSQKCCVKVTQDTYDRTLIRTASSGENLNLVPPLSRKCTGALNARDKGRSTPVNDAPQGENYEMTQLLLAHGANVNVRGWRDKTPLDLASFEGSLDVSRLLIEHGADVDAQAVFSRGHRKLTRPLSNYRILGPTMAERSSYACVATVVAAAAVMVTTRMVNRFR